MNNLTKSHMHLINELRERARTLEDQLAIADQIFENVNRVLDENEIGDEELQNHIGMFMENNASLLALRRQEAVEDGYPYAEYTEEPAKGFGKANTRR